MTACHSIFNSAKKDPASKTSSLLSNDTRSLYKKYDGYFEFSGIALPSTGTAPAEVSVDDDDKVPSPHSFTQDWALSVALSLDFECSLFVYTFANRTT